MRVVWSLWCTIREWKQLSSGCWSSIVPKQAWPLWKFSKYKKQLLNCSKTEHKGKNNVGDVAWFCIMRRVLCSTLNSRLLPFLNDDDDGAQQQDEDYQTSSTHPKNQAHLLGVLGHLQSLAMIFAGRWKQKNRCTLYRHNWNTEYKETRLECANDSQGSVKWKEPLCEYKLKIHSYEEWIIHANKTFFLIRYFFSHGNTDVRCAHPEYFEEIHWITRVFLMPMPHFNNSGIFK